ncbi:AAA family ATPase [Actinomyces sp. S4-C9]|uniref:AAA family ATPase n=1 Tax=Actinomyces sp. S4-C9 TaxID=1219581 RepID=UPI00050E1B07|nr:ATP-binding protein [Actinomyces sp. S4-C9]KGF01621.1 hypothetical protein HMPREF1628_04710 [Actinomyces sp. S4-C9]
MKILSFSVSNHRSFRDGFFLDLTNGTLKTNTLRPGEEWTDYTLPVAGIFGANAAGKTAVIDAFNYVGSAIANSGTAWQGFPNMLRAPFVLDAESEREPSTYGLDFVLDLEDEFPGIPKGQYRFWYEFAVDEKGVVGEHLDIYKSRRPTLLFDRHREGGNTPLKLGHGMGSIEVAPKELVLSRALQLEKGLLSEIAKKILGYLTIYRVGDQAMQQRLDSIATELKSGDLRLDDLVSLARVADVGIEKIFVEETEAPEEFSKFVRELHRRMQRDSSADNQEESLKPEDIDENLIIRSLRFKHRSSGNPAHKFELADESSGTLAWLALAVDVVTRLREGGVLCVDELDTSLHPYLAALVVSVFQSPEYNPHGAQLVFTSHDTTLLGQQSETNLSKRQVWYVEKDSNGVSDLYSLADFADVGKKTNFAKQYLEGRFGGVPRVAPALLWQLVHKDDVWDANKVEAMS